MDPVNITYHNDYDTACYRLRGEPVKLRFREMVGARPDGDGWEEVWDESFGTECYRSKVRLNEGRKQRAARHVRPMETVKLVPKVEVQPEEVTRAILAEKSDDEVRILQLEAKIKALLGL